MTATTPSTGPNPPTMPEAPGEPTPRRRRAEAAGPVGFAAAVRIVAEREVSMKLRDRTFLLSTAFALILIIAGFAAPTLLDFGSTYRVAAAGGEAEQIVADIRAGATADEDETGIAVEVVAAADADEAERLVLDGDADVAILDREAGSTGAPVEVVATTDVPPDISALLTEVLTARNAAAVLDGLGVSAAQASQVLTPVLAPERLLDPGVAGVGVSLLLELAFAFVFFFTALTFGLMIAQSVTEEKQQRVVEILVAVVPVRSLLVGKILANVALALGQIVLLIGVGLLAAAVAGQAELVPLVAGSSGWFVVFFLVGFLMLSCLWAATGAMASRVEDLGTMTLPLQLFVMLPFFAAVMVRGEVERAVLSYVPFSSPIVMPQRLVAGEAMWWEALLSLGLVMVTAAVLVVVAERLYRGSLLRTGGRASLRQAWRAVED